MTRALTVELSESAYAALERGAQAAAQSPAELAAAALEQRFGSPDGPRERGTTEAEKQAARLRFERHFGAVDLGHPTGTDNEAIDADLARAYADDHEAS
jgi:hypothetical protein